MNVDAEHELMRLEAGLFHASFSAALAALSGTERLGHTTAAASYGRGVLETLGRLREHAPEAADRLAETWQRLLGDVARVEAETLQGAR